MTRRCGFALVDLVVLFVVLTVSVGIALPAVQKMREADARVKCTNNMKQLGAAALKYANTKGGLPYSAITKNSEQPPYIPYLTGYEAVPGKPGGTLGRSSGLVHLLPFLEKNDILPLYTFGRDWSDPVNAKALKATIDGFRCPSVPYADETVPHNGPTYVTGDNTAFAPPAAPGSSTNILGAPVYPTKKIDKDKAIVGWSADYGSLNQVKTKKGPSGEPIEYVNPLVAAAYPKFSPLGGAMSINATTRLVAITDGTSNTILYGEAAGRSRQCFAGGKCKPFDPATPAGPAWADADNRLTVTGTDPTGADETKFGKGGCVVNCNNLQGDVYSFHPDGANIVFADGSVRFVKQSVNIAVLAALVTRAGGEEIKPNSY